MDSMPHLVISSSSMMVVGCSSLTLGPQEGELAFFALLLDDFWKDFLDDFLEDFMEDFMEDCLEDFLEDSLGDFFEDFSKDFFEDFLDLFENDFVMTFFIHAAHCIGQQQRSSRAKVK